MVCGTGRAKSTLSRLEHPLPPTGKPSRNAKIAHAPRSFRTCWSTCTSTLGRSRLLLAIEPNDSAVQGSQEGRFCHSYEDHYCFLPLYISCAGCPFLALLRPNNADTAGGAPGPHWPGNSRLVARVECQLDDDADGNREDGSPRPSLAGRG